MSTSNIAYSSNTTITIAPASLASSSTFLTGVESDQIDNTSNLYHDALVQGKVTVGTTPTANTQILVYVWGANTSLATTALDVLDGTSSAETLSNSGILYTTLKLGAVITVTATTSDIAYPFAPFTVASLFGTMPKYWGLFVAHNTGVALNATAGNHVFEYNGITYTSA